MLTTHRPRPVPSFNPRACVRRDRCWDSRIWTSFSFNPRACVRRDTTRARLSGWSDSFNPRACVRRDVRSCRQSKGPPSGFNPRACVRRDNRLYFVTSEGPKFQSTRLREARRFHHNSLRDKDFFYEIREPVPPLDSKDAGRVGTM